MKILRIDHKTFREFIKSGIKICGVYIWYFHKECVYVGASINCLQRGLRIFISDGHNSLTNKKIKFYKNKYGNKSINVIILPCNTSELRTNEEFYYEIARPKTAVSWFTKYPHNKPKEAL